MCIYICIWLMRIIIFVKEMHTGAVLFSNFSHGHSEQISSCFSIFHLLLFLSGIWFNTWLSIYSVQYYLNSIIDSKSLYLRIIVESFILLVRKCNVLLFNEVDHSVHCIFHCLYIIFFDIASVTTNKLYNSTVICHLISVHIKGIIIRCSLVMRQCN